MYLVLEYNSSPFYRNCLAKLGTIQCVSNVVRQMLSGINLNFQQKHFDTAKEVSDVTLTADTFYTLLYTHC